MTVRRLEGAQQMIAIISAARATHNIGPRADKRLGRALSFYEFFIDEMGRSLQEWRKMTETPD